MITTSDELALDCSAGDICSAGWVTRTCNLRIYKKLGAEYKN